MDLLEMIGDVFCEVENILNAAFFASICILMPVLFIGVADTVNVSKANTIQVVVIEVNKN